MNLRLHPIAAATRLALSGALPPALAQGVAQAPTAPAPAARAPVAASAASAPDVQRVEVTGIRASLEQSIARKRAADSVVEIVTAEDIGKLPDKNVADAI